MNKGLKWALISLPILIGGFIVYRTLRPKAPKLPEPGRGGGTLSPGGGGTPSGGGGGYTPPPSPKPDFPIGLGSKGAKVKELQQAIVDNGQANIVSLLGANPTDGKFGTGTEKAVKALLGKTKIDSQADIDNIKKLKAQRIANQTAAQGDANRKFYGNLIVNGLCKSGKELYSVNSAGKIFKYKFDSTKTRQIESKSYTYGIGERAKPWNNCSNIKSQTLDASGFVTIWTVEGGNNYKYSFTPYDFEVK